MLNVEAFGAKIAEHYADIYSELSENGVMIPSNDIAVAATARFRGVGVLVGENDEKYFKRVLKLHVVVC